MKINKSIDYSAAYHYHSQPVLQHMRGEGKVENKRGEERRGVALCGSEQG